MKTGFAERTKMLLVVFLFIAVLFIVLGIIFASGRGADLIAGYNTASPNEKAHTDEKKLLKTMSVFMFVLAGCFLVSASSEIFNLKLLIWLGQTLFVVVLIAGLIYLNTGKRFRK